MKLPNIPDMTPTALFWWIVGMVLFGVILSSCIGFSIFSYCGGQSIDPNKFSFCGVVATSPPWTQLAALTAGPAIVLTWIWRTVFRQADLKKKEQEIAELHSQASAAHNQASAMQADLEYKKFKQNL